mmetsp:Transcript_9677/g.13682  ORF Transcript_9677/g.13682 Transcript_9677/m.13682 type:complete len:276 (+) Transcript_9677:189-1016(+)
MAVETPAKNLTSVSSSAYSFYLNIVVLDHLVPEPNTPSRTVSEDVVDENMGEEVEESAPEVNLAPAAEDLSLSPSRGNGTDKTKKFEKVLNKSLHGLKEGMDGIDKSFRSNMRGLTQRSQNVSTKAAAFVASKTMVTRALTSLKKTMPEMEAHATNLELTIGKRFNQGKVIVLHVGLKAAAMGKYIEEVDGEDSAEHYRSAMSTLKLMGATESMGSLEREMLPKVRKGLMDKLADLLVTTMKDKEKGLEIECIALEESEEARWLFTFMEFQAQMK